MSGAASDLSAMGFLQAGRFVADASDSNRMKFEAIIEILPKSPGVYAFLVNDKVIYIGSATSAGKGLSRRVVQYCHDKRRSNARPVHGLLRSILDKPILDQRPAIDVWIMPTEEDLPIGDKRLFVDVAIGVEAWLIKKFKPDGNLRGRGRSVVKPGS